MKISVHESDKEDNSPANTHSTKDTTRNLQKVQDRLRSRHEPYYYHSSKNTPRRGMDGVGGTRSTVDVSALPATTSQEQTPSFATKLLSFGRRRAASPNDEHENVSLLGSVLSAATTPLRAAWEMVASRSSPALEERDDRDVMLNASRQGVVEDTPDIDLQEDSCMVEALKERTPSPQTAAGTQQGGVGAPGPNMHTPFDGVLGMLKEGPLAGGTPLRFPSPKKSTASVQPKAMPQSVVRQQQGAATPAFSFDSTRKNLTSLQKFGYASKIEQPMDSTPQNTRGIQKSMVFGAMRGSMAARGTPAPSLAWTPLRATPLAQNTRSRFVSTGGRKTRFETLDTEGVSRKRRADDVHGMTPSVDDGSVSLLDMQRRRRFKPSEDPGSTQLRRSWRAGRTPYRTLSHYKRRIDSNVVQPENSGMEASPNAKPTSETARRILETLNSMEESIKKSKEPLTPLDARKYTAAATPPPPPGTSMGGVMLSGRESEGLGKEQKSRLSTEEAKLPHMEVVPSTKVQTSHVGEPRDSHISLDQDGSMQRSKKAKRKAVEEVENIAKSSPIIVTQTQTTPLSSPSPLDTNTIQDTQTIVSAVEAKKKDPEVVYVFGNKKNKIKESMTNVLKDVMASSDNSTFTFGKEKLSPSPVQGVFGKAAKDPKPLVAAPTPASGTWNSDFLKKNAEAAAEVAAAVEKEVSKEPSPSPALSASTPAFSFGAPAASPPIQFGAAGKKSEEAQVTFPAAAAPASGELGSDLLRKNGETAAAVEKEVSKEPSPSPALSASTPAFSFGVATASPPIQFGAAVKKSEEAQTGFPTAPAPASGGWGSNQQKENAAVDAVATKKLDTPSFNFGSSGQPQSSEPVKINASGFGGTFGSQSMDNNTTKDGAANGTSGGSQTGFSFGQPSNNTGATNPSPLPAFNTGQSTAPPFTFGASSAQASSAKVTFGSTTTASMTAPANSGFSFGMSGSQPSSGGFGGTPNAGFGSAGFGNTNGGFGNQAPGFSSSGFGMNAQPTAQPAAPFGSGSSAAAFGGPAPTNAFGTGNMNAFGQPQATQFGAPQNAGFGGGFAGPSAFPQPSPAGQMIPNQDNPFGGGMPAAGGFSLGSSGNTTSEGRRKVKVKRRGR